MVALFSPDLDDLNSSNDHRNHNRLQACFLYAIIENYYCSFDFVPEEPLPLP